ncbi:hypothetical protein EUGRSUZ_D00604 [Eucalyptus grandis]|uniref:Uncharacterized protein n=2 Tax=Eucalyptus grandis TaxID=71139 RepID=A0ACC3L329_EUCGR|nr:hypothetical protein EUGRSUZ_D00604 [Eucalyptus grandis]
MHLNISAMLNSEYCYHYILSSNVCFIVQISQPTFFNYLGCKSSPSFILNQGFNQGSYTTSEILNTDKLGPISQEEHK